MFAFNDVEPVLSKTLDGANAPIEILFLKSTTCPEVLNARKRAWFSEQAYSPSTLQKKWTSIHQKAEEQHIKTNKVNLWDAVLGKLPDLSHPPRHQSKLRNVLPEQVLQRNTKDLWTTDKESVLLPVEAPYSYPMENLQVKPNHITVCNLHGS